MKTFTVTTKSGKTFNVRLLDVAIGNYYKKLGTEGGWDKDAEIEVDGKWYRCQASNAKDVKTVCINKYSKELRNVLHIPDSVNSNVHIKADTDWHVLYNELLKENDQQWEKDGNNASFSKVKFTHHSHRGYCDYSWDNTLDSVYMKYNKRISDLRTALRYVDSKLLTEYKIDDDYDDYNCWTKYEISESDIDKIIEIAKPGLEKADEASKAAEIARVKHQEKNDNIASGCIYFHCESTPHNEDLSNAILNRPCPNGGLFTIEHRINEQLFNRIRKYGRYWDADWLEECDMFNSSPGWRFSVEAVNELTKTNKVFVDNILLK